jgi:hypothetical protein
MPMVFLGKQAASIRDSNFSAPVSYTYGLQLTFGNGMTMVGSVHNGTPAVNLLK